MAATRQARFLALSLAFALAAVWAASAEDVETAFLGGKTVRFVAGSVTGGGYVVYSRLTAPYLAKVLGAPVIVENQPGAGGIISLIKLCAAAPAGLIMSFAN